jgi:hypothetical protein
LFFWEKNEKKKKKKRKKSGEQGGHEPELITKFNELELN